MGGWVVMVGVWVGCLGWKVGGWRVYGLERAG